MPRLRELDAHSRSGHALALDFFKCALRLKQSPGSRPHTPIQRSIPHRLGGVLSLDVVASFQISNRARHPKHLAMNSSANILPSTRRYVFHVLR
jgi:hypothetical protein